jgi:Competence protein CoiA-like family
MLFAKVNGEKIEAGPQTTGICPLCGGTVFSRCGEVNIWHWAHFKDKNCDSWCEPETEWHKNWKLVFGKDNCEIIMNKDGVKHIADIQTKENIVIELQNSPIQKSIIRSRETFYGERMIWIINGNHFRDNFSTFRYRSPQLEADDEYDRLHNPLSTQYGNVDNSRKGELKFSWSRARKSWSDVQRPVFIDLGGDDLFRVKEGMGTGSGKGKHVSKENFIKKYGGNLGLLATLKS